MVYSILPVLVTTLIPVIHCALHLMIFSIYGLYPSHLIIIHNSNCDNRAIPHLLSISIEVLVETKEVIKVMKMNKEQRLETKENVGVSVVARHLGTAPSGLELAGEADSPAKV